MGDAPMTAPKVTSASQHTSLLGAPRIRSLAASVPSVAAAVDTEDAANQLMDLAEIHLRNFFPTHQTSLLLTDYIYRRHEPVSIAGPAS